MREFFTSAETAYTGSLPSIDILTLNDKESISYSFASIQQLDVFWGHAQNIVVHATPANEAVYTYDPHYWFFIGRPDSEPRLIDEIASLGKQFLMTVGYSTPLDRVLQRHFTDDMRQYHMQKMFEDDSYYVVVIGDYIFEARLDQATVERIQSVYARTESPYETAALELRQIPNIKARARLKVSRNKSRAHQLKGRLEKNFYVKR